MFFLFFSLSAFVHVARLLHLLPTTCPQTSPSISSLALRRKLRPACNRRALPLHEPGRALSFGRASLDRASSLACPAPI